MCWAMLKVGTCRWDVTSLKTPIFDGKNMLTKGGFLKISPQNSYPLCVKKWS